MQISLAAIIILVSSAASIVPQEPHEHHADMDRRGNVAMGFDQAKITHTFTTSDTGGVIQVLAREGSDSVTIEQIRRHLTEISKLFKSGDFSKPLFIHAQNPSGTNVMKARRAHIDYRYEDLSAGGRLTISSEDGEAIAGIHRFLRFQQLEHKR